MQRSRQFCSEHGEVLAQRKTVPHWLYWLMMVLSQGAFSAEFEFRCPKCGRLTLKSRPAED
jgi:uncharacterized protein with PIN domain